MISMRIRPLTAILILLPALLPAVLAAGDGDRKDLEAEVKKYTKAVRKDPGEPENHYHLAVALVDLERYSEAEEPIRAYTGMRADDPKGWFYLGQVLEETDRCKEAIGAYDEAASSEKAAPLKVEGPALAQKGSCLREMGRNEEALEAYRQALEAGIADEGSVWMSIGIVQSAMGDSEAAREAFDKVARSDPDNPTVHFNLGVVLLREAKKTYDAGLFAQSAEAFARSAELDPGDPQAHFQAAETWLFANQPAKAKPHLERYLELAPNGANAAEAKEYLAMVQ